MRNNEFICLSNEILLISETSYCNKSNLSVIRKKIHKLRYEVWTFWHSFYISYKQQLLEI